MIGGMLASAPNPSRFRIDSSTGLLEEVRQVVSPHCDPRPGGPPELIVLHGISLPPGEFGGPWIDRLFSGSPLGDSHPYFGQLREARVSAHVLIGRDGVATQYVPFDGRAWHAGVSSWRGRGACNDFSVGIELEGTDDSPYSDAQYPTLRALLQALRAAYPTLADAPIVGHSDIAPGRKTDPGPGFDWSRIGTQR
jgi:AmpD protein